MRQREGLYKDWLRDKLDEIPYSYWIKITLPAVLGIPDILGVIKGRFVAIELKKSSKDKPTTMQTYVLERIKACGGVGLVSYPENKKETMEALWAISG